MIGALSTAGILFPGNLLIAFAEVAMLHFFVGKVPTKSRVILSFVLALLSVLPIFLPSHQDALGLGVQFVLAALCAYKFLQFKNPTAQWRKAIWILSYGTLCCLTLMFNIILTSGAVIVAMKFHHPPIR